MKFNKYSDLEGQHAFLSPSTYHWINYDTERLTERYTTHKASLLGTELHAFASEAIKKRIKLAKGKNALSMFVNDCISYRMESEQVLYYSEYCFGTADAISFKENLLRIFDLKTGKTPASFKQLDVYAALFCLEYNYKPSSIKIEERIYQNGECIINIPSPEEIDGIMNTIVKHDKLLRKLAKEV